MDKVEFMFYSVYYLGAMKRGRGMCGTFKAFKLTYLHVLCSLTYSRLAFDLRNVVAYYCLVPIPRKLNSSSMAADLSHLQSVDKISKCMVVVR